MGISLTATGWFMYIDIPQTPNAVVICVIIYNAFFGYSWGPIPWLYPPEVRDRAIFHSCSPSHTHEDPASQRSRQGRISIDRD